MLRRDHKVTLQINLAPPDAPHARHILPHQLRQLAGQVDEILLLLDLDRSRGRFGESWDEGLPQIRQLMTSMRDTYGHVRGLTVDYAPSVRQAVSVRFFGGQLLPAKDWRGGPFYAYFFGLHEATHDFILHLDSDIMLGGGSTTWVDEAVCLLTERPDVLVVGPLPGPPTADGRIRPQREVPEPLSSPAFRFTDLSTRVFLLDRQRFLSTVRQLTLSRAAPHRAKHALTRGHPPYDLPEDIWSRAMQEHSLWRIDFLGRHPGLWSLHPLTRPEVFYKQLPDLIQRIESNDIPEGQRGDYDLNDSMVRLAPAPTRRWWQRWRK